MSAAAIAGHACPFCKVPAGSECETASGSPTSIHAKRAELVRCQHTNPLPHGYMQAAGRRRPDGDATREYVRQ
jgi:hypothetical protein